MLALLTTTLATSFFDSLNPSAIAQQMLLQATVKKKRHVWFFILGIALANYVMGVAVYYGVAARLMRVWEWGVTVYPTQIRGAELTLGLACLAAGVRLIVRTGKQPADNAEQAVKIPERRLGPAALFLMGVMFCAVELTSALPYFGFLAVLAGYQLAAPYVLLLILLYSAVYALPLMLIYFAYNRLSGSGLILRLERVLGKVAAYILPGAVTVLGAALSLNGAYGLF